MSYNVPTSKTQMTRFGGKTMTYMMVPLNPSISRSTYLNILELAEAQWVPETQGRSHTKLLENIANWSWFMANMEVEKKAHNATKSTWICTANDQAIFPYIRQQCFLQLCHVLGVDDSCYRGNGPEQFLSWFLIGQDCKKYRRYLHSRDSQQY